MNRGHLVGPYEVETLVGKGGMGVVYRARDTRLGRTVALKFLPAHLRLSARAKERFVREAKAVSALDHPNICSIHDIATTAEGDLYLVMAYYQGQTLQALLDDGHLPVDRVLNIGVQLAAALEAAHSSGVVHRDLKPSNVLITDLEQVKLLDFGVAQLASDPSNSPNGSTPGTASYMSPEQIDGERVDNRSDLWGLGVLLYEMLAGAPPFHGDSHVTAVVSVLQSDPEPLAPRRPDAPPSVITLVESCLDKTVERRPVDARYVREVLQGELDRFADDIDTHTWVTPARLGLIAGGVALLAFLLVTMLFRM